MICDQGEVVVVPFPFVDMPVSKPRPALVLSAKAFNESEDHTILAMITTAAASRWISDYAIQNLASAGLKAECVVRLKVFTLENRLVSRAAGRLNPADWSGVQRVLSQAGF